VIVFPEYRENLSTCLSRRIIIISKSFVLSIVLGPPPSFFGETLAGIIPAECKSDTNYGAVSTRLIQTQEVFRAVEIRDDGNGSKLRSLTSRGDFSSKFLGKLRIGDRSKSNSG